MLNIENLVVYYGEVQAIKDISLEINEGEIVTLLGANGAGKTTILRTITGFVKPRSGKVFLAGKDITAMQPQDIVKEGIALVPEGRRVFTNLTILENLEMGAWLQKDKAKSQHTMELVFSLFPILKERIKQRAGTLSGGEQQMLAISRALMSHPRILLMDEPSLGLAPILVAQLFRTIKELFEKENFTLLLVEQNVRAALKIAGSGYLLETGKVVTHGSTKELTENKDIYKAYIGGH